MAQTTKSAISGNQHTKGNTNDTPGHRKIDNRDSAAYNISTKKKRSRQSGAKKHKVRNQRQPHTKGNTRPKQTPKQNKKHRASLTAKGV